ncbi:acyl-CoA N-acyltransferase [Hymenopellis radicata]|nr:acyl-CoA N-acyltransferase [Hymenopellis radicata]
MLHDGSKAVKQANKLSSKTLEKHIAATEESSPYVGSSMGWDEQEKRDELFSIHSRYILVRNNGSLVGYTSFRFEHEDDWDILYCYEVQVLGSYQRQGLGRALMHHLISIGKKCQMEKINLTVFKVNVAAGALYRNLGFSLDESSPDEEDGADYEILCYSLE